MKVLILFICLCLTLANAKPLVAHPYVGTPFVGTPFVGTPFVGTPFGGSQFVFVNPTNPQVTPTFRTAVTPVSPYPFAFNRYHTQDRNGAYTFSYSGGPSSKIESRDQSGNVVGAFNYVDPEGKIQTQHYVSDKNGFRVAGTNLPVEPVVTVKDNKVTRTKRDTTTVGKTPANTVPLKTFPFTQIVPQVYTSGVAPQIVPNVYPVNTNFIPNTYTTSQQFPYTTYPFNTFPTFYTVPTVVPTTDTKATTKVETETTPVQPIVYSGIKNPTFTFDPNFFTRYFNTQKTPNTGFTYYY